MRFRFNRIILFCIFWFSCVLAQNPLKIYCIDVNTGSATLIVSPTNKYILIDAGMTNYGNHTVTPFIQNLGITHLDHTVATHYHEDHIGGLDEVIYALSGGAGHNESILGYCYDRGDSNPPSNTIFTGYANAASSKRRIIGLGETLDLGGGAFMYCYVRNCRVMNGTGATPSSGENSRSIGFILQYGLFRLSISGDLTGYAVSGDPDVETKAAAVTGDVSVYVVNHHGGRNSSNTVYLDSLRPEAAVISQGTIPSNNGHPHQEALDRLANRNAYIYQMNDNPSGGTIPAGHGRILNTTAAITVNQASYIINGDEYILPGVQRDGACLEIISPRDTITEASIITPIARIQNLGNTAESFRIRMRIGDSYNRTQTIYNLAPNDTMTVAFDTMWYAIRGEYQISCSTEVFGDNNSANDQQITNLIVANHDTEIQDILIPAQGTTFFLNETLTPTVIVKDNSAFTIPIPVKLFCLIQNSQIIYSDSTEKMSYPGITDTVRFTLMPLSNVNEGIYTCSVWVVRPNDIQPDNNTKSTHFNITDPNSITEQEISIINDNAVLKSLTCKLFNISGQLLQTQTLINTTIKSVDGIFTNISPGVYFIHITGFPYNITQTFRATRKILILPHN